MKILIARLDPLVKEVRRLADAQENLNRILAAHLGVNLTERMPVTDEERIEVTYASDEDSTTIELHDLERKLGLRAPEPEE